MSDEILNLSNLQLDALREIGNVGAGNSATALSQIINRKIDMTVPKIAIMPLGEVPDVVGGPDAMVAGVYLRVYGPAPSSILFLLPRDSAFYLVDMLMGREQGHTTSLNSMDESALMEIGNILAGAYLNALSHFTKLTLLPSIPALAMDMAGAILSVILIQLGQMGDHALVIETEFTTESDGVKGHFFLIPDPGSLNTILAAIGVKE
ncbi:MULTISPECIES: chemotaxis protein CheC [unclassified Pelosinus]|uniref:chemotaxis protein CheC n=1 Tax=unclassified Pelosinus TaxID=2629460 RepID=UPI0004D0CA5F|nr:MULTISPECIES: chemotaxis protein CheC [unclassified Pelosinus]AIF52101.1 CheC, phosphatase, inhibitor of MCP methylation [Pelosinus sp. UFO1]GMA99738.1 CheY-P-specific phosphatase CheC [Pelosinus sp. IPA-1]